MEQTSYRLYLLRTWPGGEWTKSTISKSRVPKVSTNFRVVQKRCCLLHNVRIELILSRVSLLQNPRKYYHLQFQREKLPLSDADDFVEHSNPILIKTSTKMGPTDDLKVEPEVRDFIRPGYRTEDSANIVEDCGPQCVTVDNGAEGKYVQVRKIAEVHESSK